jgi:hypothetical protein
MFGFGKNKKDESKKKDILVNTAFSLLRIQIEMGNAEDNDDLGERLASSYGQGYLLGFCDSLLQASGFNDQQESFELLTRIYTDLFGRDLGGSILSQSINAQDDKEFNKGLMLGATSPRPQ